VGAEQEEEGGLLKAKAVNEVDAEPDRATPEDSGGGGGGSGTASFKDPALNNGPGVHIVVGGGDSELLLPAAADEKYEHASSSKEEGEGDSVAAQNKVVKGSVCSCGAAVVHYRFRV
jgi:hypothetical protein